MSDEFDLPRKNIWNVISFKVHDSLLTYIKIFSECMSRTARFWFFWRTSFSSEQNTPLRRDFIQIQNYPIDLQGTALRQAPVDDVYVIAHRLRTRSQAPNDVGNDTKFPHAEP